MLSPEEIAEQQQLLAAHRRTLAIYLRQQAEIGPAYSPPALINGIEHARSNIRRIKTTLNAAGVTVAEDPDDEEPQPSHRRPVAVPRQDPMFPRWLGLAVASVLVIGLAAGGGWWWLSRQPGNTPPPQATPSSLKATASAEAPPEATAPAETDLAALESQLMKANIALSAVQVDQVRGYINDPNTGYKLLAEHALQVVGDQKFRDTLYLDELDTRYTNLVGEDHYAEFNDDQLKAGMVSAWNEHYPDQKVTSFDEIVEPRS
jgi:hypothetical protein